MTPRVRLPEDDGFEVYVYFDDHHPPHAHVFCSGGEATIALGSAAKAPYVLRSKALRERDKLRALRLVEQYQEKLLATWEKFNV